MNEPARPQDRLAGVAQKSRLQIPGFCVRSAIAGALAIFLAVPMSEAADAWQTAPQEAPAAAPADAQQPPDAPVPADARQQNSRQTAQPASDGQQQNPQSMGTAAAPVENPVGVPGSKPAGAVIAPAKQKRERSFAIRVAILVGAAVGVGTVIALSNASPSRPH